MKKAIIVTIRDRWGSIIGSFIFKDRVDLWNYITENEIKLQKETTYKQGLHQTLGKNGFYKSLNNLDKLININTEQSWIISNMEDVIGSWEMI